MKDTFKEMVEEVSKLDTIEDAIALASKREKDARAFYREKASATEDVQLKELYTYLAEEEGKHLGYLETYREKLELPDEEAKAPGTQSFTPEFKQTDSRLGAIGVLIAAMRHERKSEYFYSELAKQAGNEPRRKFFEMLAGYERGHYELIDNYLESMTEFRMQT
ncbi:MAG: ferritin family protein [Methanosarcinaceae archaeon]|nr:ferritin family protein [Methanosarcinaceae archaeon]